jgi:hypothetical protein
LPPGHFDSVRASPGRPSPNGPVAASRQQTAPNPPPPRPVPRNSPAKSRDS